VGFLCGGWLAQNPLGQLSDEALAALMRTQFGAKQLGYPGEWKSFLISKYPRIEFNYHAYPDAREAKNAFDIEKKFIAVPMGPLTANGLWEDSATFGNGCMVLAKNAIIRVDTQYILSQKDKDELAEAYVVKFLKAVGAQK